ncbi:hypothetical protein [Arachidicoccus terrestris]|uniref:hypothetical protein n=1 Tax=Arachidicoccus terrestris TaxID=2875539 RepID=UPI001CC53DB0|nr:hypothetical protein [Arachidicoccus terrestris]UAY55668.1 hypothetical protein K9M52_01150 [Arachidicoccus terrestris]
MERITFSRDELYDLVWKAPMLTLAKKYDITDVGLRKVCLRMDIPLPPQGYWQKVQFGKKVKRLPLPVKHDGENHYELKTRDEDNAFRHGQLSVLHAKQLEIENGLAEHLVVPDRLSNPLKIVSETRDFMLANKRNYSPFKGVIENGPNLLTTRVAPTNVGRALRIWDSLIKLLQLRKHSVELTQRKSLVVIDGEQFEVCLKERLVRKEVPTSWRTTTEFHPSGLLYFKVERFYCKEWIDGKLKLEQQLSKILAFLEVKASEAKVEREKREKLAAANEARIQSEKEAWQKKIDELDAFKCLLDESERWQKIKIMRAYISDVEQLIEKNAGSRDYSVVRKWIDWAKDKVNWYDPYILQMDPLLDEVDRESLDFKKRPPYNLGFK